MGTRIVIGDYPYEASSFSVAEDSTPIASGDTSGGVGSFSFSFPAPIDDAHDAITYTNLFTNPRMVSTAGSILIDDPSYPGFGIGVM